MAVDCDDLLVIADVSVSAHPADDVAQSVDLNLVEPDLLHLCLDAGDDFLLLRALARVGNHRSEKPRKVTAVSFCCLFDLFVIETHVHTLHKTICVHLLNLLLTLPHFCLSGQPSVADKLFFSGLDAVGTIPDDPSEIIRIGIPLCREDQNL